MIKINLLKPKAIIQKGRWYDHPIHWRDVKLNDVLIEAIRDRTWKENHHDFINGITIKL